MKHLLFICVYLCSSVVGFLASCAPAPAPRAIIPSAPPRSAPAAPVIAAANSTQSASTAASAKLESQVNLLRQSASDLQDGMAEAVLEADRLRKQKSATEADLDGLWQKLTNLQTRNLFLEAEAETAVTYAVEQKERRAAAEQAVTDLTALTTAQEAELSSYRVKYQDLATAYHASEKSRAIADAARAAAEKQAAVGNYLRRCLFGLVALIAAYFVIKLFIPSLRLP